MLNVVEVHSLDDLDHARKSNESIANEFDSLNPKESIHIVGRESVVVHGRAGGIREEWWGVGGSGERKTRGRERER